MNIIYLDKKHDPHKNEALINKFLKGAPKTKEVFGERDGFFNSFSKKPVQIAIEKKTFGSFLKKRSCQALFAFFLLPLKKTA